MACHVGLYIIILIGGLDTWIFVCHVGGFRLLVDGKDNFKNDFQILGMKFAKKSILGPKWELTQNVGAESAFSLVVKRSIKKSK